MTNPTRDLYAVTGRCSDDECGVIMVVAATSETPDETRKSIEAGVFLDSEPQCPACGEDMDFDWVDPVEHVLTRWRSL